MIDYAKEKLEEQKGDVYNSSLFKLVSEADHVAKWLRNTYNANASRLSNFSRSAREEDYKRDKARTNPEDYYIFAFFNVRIWICYTPNINRYFLAFQNCTPLDDEFRSITPKEVNYFSDFSRYGEWQFLEEAQEEWICQICRFLYSHYKHWFPLKVNKQLELF